MAGSDNFLKMMEDRLAEIEAEAEKIRNAIAAYTGKPVTKIKSLSPKRTVKWTDEIRKALNSGVELDFNEMKQLLLDKGIDELNDATGRSSLKTTLNRMSKPDGEIILTEENKYKKKAIKLRRRRPASLLPADQHSGEDE
jgi:ribosomal protein L16 Arg81 hydroxylase